MSRLLNNAAVLTWLFLVGASLATFGLAESHHPNAGQAVTFVMLIAAVKARMIVLHYMELKHAPRGWRVAFELWVVVVPVLVLALWHSG